MDGHSFFHPVTKFAFISSLLQTLDTAAVSSKLINNFFAHIVLYDVIITLQYFMFVPLFIQHVAFLCVFKIFF